MKRVLLTGASGFVGSHVLRHFLVNTDWEIVCPTTFTHKGIQDRIRVATDGIEDVFKRVKVVKTDLTAPVSPVTAAVWGRIDYVVNVASESHVKRSIDDLLKAVLLAFRNAFLLYKSKVSMTLYTLSIPVPSRIFQ
jgi:dTDP-glucose 4,6-dehydratase